MYFVKNFCYDAIFKKINVITNNVWNNVIVMRG